MAVLLVAVGGVLGVLARYGVGRAAPDAGIWATAAINVAGSFLLGVLVASAWLSRDVRDGVGIGFLGGFTTFSTFSVHVVQALDAGEAGRAAGYAAASVIGGVVAAAVGYALGRQLG